VEPFAGIPAGVVTMDVGLAPPLPPLPPEPDLGVVMGVEVEPLPPEPLMRMREGPVTAGVPLPPLPPAGELVLVGATEI